MSYPARAEGLVNSTLKFDFCFRESSEQFPTFVSYDIFLPFKKVQHGFYCNVDIAMGITTLFFMKKIKKKKTTKQSKID